MTAPTRRGLSRALQPVVLYETPSLIAVSKPERCGVQAEPESQTGTRWSELVRGLRRRYGPVHPVHRLDANVTGVLLMARTSQAGTTRRAIRTDGTAAALSKQFARRRVRKTYLALLTRTPVAHGQPSVAMYDGSLGHLCARHIAMRTDERGLERMHVVESGDAGALGAAMRWRLLEAADDGLALIQLEPEDGRRHMLRVLCAGALGAGILGDFKYERSRRHARFGFQKSGRICLHALELAFKVRRALRAAELTSIGRPRDGDCSRADR